VGYPYTWTLRTAGGSPTFYYYDWDGDGLVDSSGPAPEPSHTWSTPGSYRPQVIVTAGLEVSWAYGPTITVTEPQTANIFADGFESGGTGAWN
jgi:hypothetical protein